MQSTPVVIAVGRARSKINSSIADEREDKRRKLYWLLSLFYQLSSKRLDSMHLVLHINDSLKVLIGVQFKWCWCLGHVIQGYLRFHYFSISKCGVTDLGKDIRVQLFSTFFRPPDSYVSIIFSFLFLFLFLFSFCCALFLFFQNFCSCCFILLACACWNDMNWVNFVIIWHVDWIISGLNGIRWDIYH